MTGNIRWRSNFEEARKEAKEKGKLLFLFFHHPDCDGCNKTINETLTDNDVKGLIEKEFIPLTFVVTESPEIAGRYNVDWTPAFIIADADGMERERSVGFLPPEDFIAQLELSEGLADMHMERFSEAERCFEEVIQKHTQTEVAPEACYYLGVSQYKESGYAKYLQKASKTLINLFPDNAWAKRASVWA